MLSTLQHKSASELYCYCRYIDMAVERTEQGRQNAAAYELTKQATEAGSNERSPPTPYCALCTLSVSEAPLRVYY
eukprot:jgi/Chrzof1/11219/Cz05g28140.t1